jgi:hypothetical protein
MNPADLQRFEFLQTLCRRPLPPGMNSVDHLTGWEQEFLASFRHSSRPSLWFTHRRRAATDRLREKYKFENDQDISAYARRN